MSIPKKDFFTNNELIFIGYSSDPKDISRLFYNALVKSGIKVFPVNAKNAEFDIKVYKNISELPKIPETAYILLRKDNVKDAVEQLIQKGIKRILFHNSKIVDESIIDICKKNNIQIAFACPMMIFGGGLHKVHAFFAGMKK